MLILFCFALFQFMFANLFDSFDVLGLFHDEDTCESVDCAAGHYFNTNNMIEESRNEFCGFSKFRRIIEFDVSDLDICGFGVCCDERVLCYGTCEESKRSCDDGFMECMSDSLEWWRVIGGICPIMADFLYSEISNEGCHHFEEAQLRGCQCRTPIRCDDLECPNNNNHDDDGLCHCGCDPFLAIHNENCFIMTQSEEEEMFIECDSFINCQDASLVQSHYGKDDGCQCCDHDEDEDQFGIDADCVFDVSGLWGENMKRKKEKEEGSITKKMMITSKKSHQRYTKMRKRRIKALQERERKKKNKRK